jgi:GNAT superfamily N-acetyltransferase
MPPPISILPVEHPRDLTTFIRLPWTIYQHYPHWVPPLLAAQEDLFDFQQNPFWFHREYSLVLAVRNHQAVGRIGVFVAKTGDGARQGTFGFLECIDEYDVFHALTEHAISWLRERQVMNITGPFNPSLHHESGVLLEGFDKTPYFMMPYTAPYYPALYERAGFSTAMNFRAYAIPVAQTILDERLVSATSYLMKKNGITVRSADKQRTGEELKTLHYLYNQSFSEHWGFEPVNQEEFLHLSEGLLQIADPELILMAEQAGKPIGFVLCVPDFNEVFRRIKDGKLWPTGLLKLLWYKRKIKNVRVMTIGVLPAYRKTGAGPILMRKITEKIIEKGYQGGEISWVAEDNLAMIQSAEKIGGILDKRTCLYTKKLA